MGFIKAFTGSLSGAFADQWLEYMKPDIDGLGSTAKLGIFPAVKVNAPQNTKGNDNIITNGTKILVPEGTALVTMLDGQITGCIVEPGGYTYTSTDPNAKSFFAGEGLGDAIGGLLQATWDRTKHGNLAAAQHNAFYVNMRPITNFQFGTPSTIYWDDAFLQTQVGAQLRGNLTLHIFDPMTFLSFVPIEYLMGGKAYDFDDEDNDSVASIFKDVVDSLAPALSIYSNDPSRGNRISGLQSSTEELALALTEAIERKHQWKTTKGIEIVNVAIEHVDYDEATREILEQAKKDDVEIRKAARMGQAYSNNMAGMMAAASGQAMQAAAGNENGAMMGFMGMNMAQNTGANMMNAVASMPGQTPVQPQPQPQPAPQAGASVNTADKLIEMKKLLDAGVISQEEFDAAKKEFLGN